MWILLWGTCLALDAGQNYDVPILQLVDEAFQRWLVEEEGVVDDITAVVVKFQYED